MANLHIYKNPFSNREFDAFELPAGARVIDWLQENYPDGCGGALRFLVNGGEKDLYDLDYAVEEDDIVQLVIHPTGLDPFTISIIVSIVIAAASYAISALLMTKPEPPPFAKTETFEASPVYSVRVNQNTARLGQPVPVVYGTVLHTPDLCSQPYKFYGTENKEYQDLLLCLGMGEFSISGVYLGDTITSSLEGGLVDVEVIPPSRHGQNMGNLGTPWDPPFYENMVTSPEVGEQEFVNIGESTGWFRLGKAGQQGQFIFADIIFPEGLYQIMDLGDITSTAVDIRLQVIETTADGAHIAGTMQEQNYAPSTAYRSPIRMTVEHDCGRVAHWAARMYRNTQREPNGGEINRWIWAGLRMAVANLPGPVYGNSTLMAVRMKASQLAAASERSIKVALQRLIPVLGSGGVTGTNNPADAFCDILTNMNYGARRPLSEVDIPRLTTLRNYWQSGGYNYGFNAVYTGKVTVWEALAQSMAVVAARPLPLGGFMSVVQDGIKPIRTVLFSEQNIKRGSFRLTYSFDEQGAHDGVEVEYRDPVTFTPAYVRQPNGSQDPEKVVLFGCTDFRQASEIALLMWQRRTQNRRVVTFETEMEGLIPKSGDRAGVQHTLPRWGQSGFVVGVKDDRVTITLDRKLKWADFTPPYVMLFRSQYGGSSNVVTATPGPTDDVAILSGDPWLDIEGDWALTLKEEITHFIWGVGDKVIKDFILTSLQPNDTGTVELAGVFYSPSVYSGTLAFLAYPVP